MERLTKIDGCGQNDLIRCFDCGPEKAGENLENCGYCSEGWQRALNRLAAYEDIGLEPEEIVELALKAAALETTEAMYEGLGRPEHLRSLVEAEKDGRLVVLHRKYRGRDGERALQKANLAVNVTNNGVNRYIVDAVAEKLVREEAEAALAGERKDGEG